MRNEHFCIGSVSRVVVSIDLMNSFFFCYYGSFFGSHKVGSSDIGPKNFDYMGIPEMNLG